ncbi:protein CTLA-2-beta-like isoform X2 [Alosa sapidissima]|uniref:protein CTLA-2-beta-like isoform X2 n=1 Tax=Alosa sapidissima TaxID=34773 RepID=UPI001C0860A7|nr:protein CTLA-2-beta-like isoform X2 [Alosa sapidissima]
MRRGVGFLIAARQLEYSTRELLYNALLFISITPWNLKEIKMATTSPSEIDQEFHEWKLKHNKVYSTPEEEARRKVLWLASREEVLAHNKLADQGVHTWWMGMNQFSDMDSANGEVPCGCMAPRNQDKKCGKSHGDC